MTDALEFQPLVGPGWDDWDVDRGHPVQLARPLAAVELAAAVPPEPSVRFLDVSHWQGAIDFQQVKAAGYVAVVAKLTEGTGFTDSRGRENIARAEAAGLVAGGYHFLRRDSSARAQLDHYLTQLQSPKWRIVALDAETAGNGTDPTLDQADEWSDLCRRELGILPWQYYPRWWLRKVGGCPTVRGPWWQSAYGPDPGPLHCGYARIAAWQYTSTGRVSGVAGDVDLNRWFGDLASLKATTVGGSEEDLSMADAASLEEQLNRIYELLSVGDATHIYSIKRTRDQLTGLPDAVEKEVLSLLQAGFGGFVPGSTDPRVRPSQEYLFKQVATLATQLGVMAEASVKLAEHVGRLDESHQQIVELLERVTGSDPATFVEALINEVHARTAPSPPPDA